MTLYATLAVAALLALAVAPAEAAHSFAVHRAADVLRAGKAFGAHGTKLDFLATPFSAVEQERQLSRRAVLIQAADVTVAAMEAMDAKKTAGIVIVLPRNLAKVSEEERSNLTAVDAWLQEGSSRTAVYFALHDPELEELYGVLERREETYQLTFDGSEAPALTAPTLLNLESTLGDAEAPAAGSTIGIVAYYDSYSSAPTLTGRGVGSDSSGVTALLETARVLSETAAATAAADRKYSVKFLLTAAGHHNFAATENWLSSRDDDILSSFAFVLCLDNVGTDGPLYLHSSKRASHAAVEPFFSALATAAAANDVKLTTVHKKVNLGDTTVPWQHEHFAVKRVPAATLSTFASPPGVQRSNLLLDSAASATATARTANIVAAAIAELMGAAAPAAVEAAPAERWSKLLGAQSRASFMLGSTDTPTIVNSLAAHLRKVSDSYSQSIFRPAKTQLVFPSPAQGTMVAALTKQITFDIVYALCVFAYLGGLYFVLQWQRGKTKPAKKA